MSFTTKSGLQFSVFFACLLFYSYNFFGQTVQTITTPGTGSIAIPANSFVIVEVWGAGGAGGDSGPSKNYGSGGGGGGAFATISFEVLSDATYSYDVGAGGSNGPSRDGESTIFYSPLAINLVEAFGGAGVSSGTDIGGSGGGFTIGTGEINMTGSGANGGNGANGTSGASGNGGGGGSSAGVTVGGVPIAGNDGSGISGGVAPNDGGTGGDGGASGSNGFNGITVGAGGGGAHRANSGGIKGGNGADGRIRITISCLNFNTWNGTTSDDWNDASNWSCGVVPSDASNGNVLISSGTPNSPVIYGTPGNSGYAFDLEIGSGAILQVIDNLIDVEGDLLIDGSLVLTGTSQLVQQSGSTFDDGSTGGISVNQQGTADLYTYNYWASPVYENKSVVSGYGGSNVNNYTVADVLPGITFVSGYDGSPAANIAENWIYKFNDKTAGDYSEWVQILSTGTVVAGEGFTMKGPGTGGVGVEYVYTFQGKPNNGDISLDLNSGNGYLVGNPYPSALDADQFITDNVPVFDGTLYFWEHWGGGSHNLSDYQGGYATYNLSGGIGTGTGTAASGGGTKVPERYIPIGQGFFITADSGGTITFSNSQRDFVTEGASSVFFKSENQKKTPEIDSRRKLRIGIEMDKGFRKEILLTEDSRATEKFDYGFDGKLIDGYSHDIYWNLEENKFSIQGVSQISKNSVFELGILMESEGEVIIRVNEFVNSPDLKKVYLLDRETKKSSEISEGSVTLNLEEGDHKGRFAITFLPKEKPFSNKKELDDGIEAVMNNVYKELQITRMVEAEIKEVAIYNLLGQKVQATSIGLNERYIRIPVAQRQGVYVLRIATDKGAVGKQIIIEE